MIPMKALISGEMRLLYVDWSFIILNCVLYDVFSTILQKYVHNYRKNIFKRYRILAYSHRRVSMILSNQERQS